MVPTHREPDAATEPDFVCWWCFPSQGPCHDERRATTTQSISLLIDMRERCEDIRGKMEAKQSRWLERENVFTFRSCIRPSKAR